MTRLSTGRCLAIGRLAAALSCSSDQGVKRGDMTSLHRTCARLEHAVGLTAVMDAAYDAFENLLAVIREHEDPANGLFAAFMFAR